jgi:hypothetical protein
MARGKIPIAQVNRRLEDIAKMIAAGLGDKEIMQQLNMPERTYYDYKARIFKIFEKNAAEKQAQRQGVVDFEAAILKDKLVRLYRALELEIVDKYKDPKLLSDVATATRAAANIAIEIFRLEYESR